MSGRPEPYDGRAWLEERWLNLSRNVLPGLAEQHRWPISADHCFQRVLLDAACGGCWYNHIVGRPAYKAASDMILERALALGEQITQEPGLLSTLNRQSLEYRGKL